MNNILQFIIANWLVVTLISVTLVTLVVLLWRNYNIDEITPTPPFIKLKRKDQSINNSNKTSINISGNKMKGQNKISVRRENSSVSDNTMTGENGIEVGAKSGRKTKGAKKKK